MKKLYYLILILLAFPLFMDSQNKEVIYVYPGYTVDLKNDPIDIQLLESKYAKSGSLDYSYKESDGTEVHMSSLKRGDNIVVYEKPPIPAIHLMYQEYYPNGHLKTKGVYLPQQFRIGKWVEYDLNNNYVITDHEDGRNGIGYNGMLEVLSNYGVGRDINNWIVYVVWFNDAGQYWGAKLRKSNQYKTLSIDAYSGEVFDEYEFVSNQ